MPLFHCLIRFIVSRGSERQASSSDCCGRVDVWDKTEGQRRGTHLGRGSPGLSWRWDGWERGHAILVDQSVVVHVDGAGVRWSLHR